VDQLAAKVRFAVAVTFAEWSTGITSERIKTCQAILRQQGRATGGKWRFGYRVIGEKGHRSLDFDREERAILVQIIQGCGGQRHCGLGQGRPDRPAGRRQDRCR
jgi:DNA invertase Pin-like site-specific DNA recombinase